MTAPLTAAGQFISRSVTRRQTVSYARCFLSNQYQEAPPVVFSGIQPTGIPHLGNYLGALRPWVLFQSEAPKETKLIYCIVDLHAITQLQDPLLLRKYRKEMMATLLAIGLDPKRSIIFEQSRVAAHSELMWILSCGASTGYLSRMTQWKSKSGIVGESSPVDGGKGTAKLKLGLFSYPVLQAADILIHRATEVPVGEDQAQHLEFTREVAAGFNHVYGEVFPLPNTVLCMISNSENSILVQLLMKWNDIATSKRVMSLREPRLKMSKSEINPKSRILLTDEPDEIALKFRKSVTDSIEGVMYDRERRPGVSNLINILGHVRGRNDLTKLSQELEGISIQKLKEELTDGVIELLKPIRVEYLRIINEGDNYLESIAADGARKAAESAEVTMEKVRKLIGLS